MLKINLNTGTAWTKSIYVKGNKSDDLIALLDEYYSTFGGFAVAEYTMNELDEEALDAMIPINGGEIYIDSIDSIEEIEDVDTIKQILLSYYLEVDFDDITSNRDYFEYGNNDYYVLTDEEADERAKEYIMDSMWAFNPDFIISHSSKLDYNNSVYNALQSIQELCESGNDIVLALIDDIDDFVDEAIALDGRGHFISSYDGEEVEFEDYYIYKN